MPGFEETYFIELNDDQPESWKEGVRRELRKIEGSRVGKILLNCIRLHQRWVMITPLRPRWVFMSPHHPYLHDANCNARSRLEKITSGGRQYGSVVEFSPEKFTAGTFCALKRKQSGDAVTELHESLFHELVHAFLHVSYAIKETTTDAQRTRLKDRLTGGVRYYTDRDEFIAILVTNIYASANGKTILRADHRGHQPMDDGFDDSVEFFQIGSTAFALVDEFCKISKHFTKLLSQVNARFNPIRAYYRDPEKVRKASQGKLATMRDRVGDNPMLEGMLPFVRP